MRRLLLIVLFVSLGAFLLAACDDDEDGADADGETPVATEEETPPAAAEIPEVAIGAVDFEFEAPASIEGGLTRLSMTNSGTEDHIAVLFRLDDGVTYDQFLERLQTIQAEPEAEDIGTFEGGPGAFPGEQGEAVIDLEPGQYVLLCPVPSPDGIPHFAKGMIQPLEVTEAPPEQPPPPQTDVTVGLSDFAFDAPDSLPVGTTTFEAVNQGAQPHEMGVVKLDEGVTPDQALEALETGASEPFTFAGVVVPMSTGRSGWTTIDLTSGTYALVCFVTDPDSGAPHIALGMYDSFTVE